MKVVQVNKRIDMESDKNKFGFEEIAVPLENYSFIRVNLKGKSNKEYFNTFSFNDEEQLIDFIESAQKWLSVKNNEI